jgi:NADPH-dependent glutamate synthase beta subunit-like oxidoreductase/formate hydrogenlyase subunit 6/NADH:ubiquinone oxidoreductase subunit I/ferredoxin
LKIDIDGRKIRALECESVLDAALANGVYIPHLCKHPDLEAVGGCRLCSVEVEGTNNSVPACKTPVVDGMRVKVHSPKAEKTRRMAMELILAFHPADCTGCPKYGKCELQSMYQYMGVIPDRWRKKSPGIPTDDSNPLIRHMFIRCVRCGRCVRVCSELRGVKVLDFLHTKDGIRVGVNGGRSLREAGCRFCGACIEVCPTGSVMDAVGLIKDDRSYADSVVPCRNACPARIDVPRYLRHIRQGDFAKAVAVIRERAPFPGTLGNVCVHVCEEDCKRNGLGAPVSVCKLKRAAAANDNGSWKTAGRKEKATGKKAAVVGAGPAGLTAAYYLAKKGHDVTVFEINEKAGGQCRYGIPAYRLPDGLLDREISDILEAGIRLKTGTEAPAPQELLRHGYDSVLIAVGTQEGIVLPMDGSALQGVYVNTDFLKRVRRGERPELGNRVVVLGGGNVAYDCARTARRLGAEEVHIACLESDAQMPAAREEIEAGAEEGIILHTARSFLKIIGDGRVEGVELQKVERFYFDENRKAVIEPKEGTNEIVLADNVIFAVGQKPMKTEDMSVELIRGAYIKTDRRLQTNICGVFAAGDVVTGTKSVIEAITAGRKSAEEMDLFLGGDGDISEQLAEPETPDSWIGRCDGFADSKRYDPATVSPEIRLKSFGAAEEVFERDAAISAAGLCLQCDLRLNLKSPTLWNHCREERSHA